MNPKKKKWPGFGFAAVMIVAGTRALVTGSLGRNLSYVAVHTSGWRVASCCSWDFGRYFTRSTPRREKRPDPSPGIRADQL
jgi:hypothetical protein